MKRIEYDEEVPVKALVMMGGGPTAVWNETLAGLVRGWRGRLEGARGGIAGWQRGEVRELSEAPDWEKLARQPGSVLGSSRLRLDDAGIDAAAERMKRDGVDVLFLSGGNGTMTLGARLAQAGVRVVGMPKTIDNDIAGCWATPGFSSCANFFVWAARDAGADNRTLPAPVMVLETLGRDTGWVTAATALARLDDEDAPHLIYLPEKQVALARICAETEEVVKRWGRCVIAVCEGLRDENGETFGAEAWVDRDGVKRLASNLGFTLAGLISRETGLRARAEKPGLVGRCASRFVTRNDRRMARRCGEAAAQMAREGAGGVMAAPVSLERVEAVDLQPAAGTARGVPQGEIPLEYLREVIGEEELPPGLGWL